MLLPIYCNACDEVMFSIEVLRHDTSNESVITKVRNFKYCPFCGQKIGVKYEKAGK